MTASVDIATGNVTDIKQLRPFSTSSNFSSLAGSITGDPLNNRLYNGIQFTLDNPDEFVNRRLGALQLQLPAAMYQAASQSEQGFVGSFNQSKFASVANHVYVSLFFFMACICTSVC